MRIKTLVARLDIARQLICGNICLVVLVMHLFPHSGGQKFGPDRYASRLNGKSDYGEWCDARSYNAREQCRVRFDCVQSRCRCPVGYGYNAGGHNSSVGGHAVGRCVKFEQFRCAENGNCRDADSNRECVSGACDCRRGHYEDSGSKRCVRRFHHQIVLNPIQRFVNKTVLKLQRLLNAKESTQSPADRNVKRKCVADRDCDYANYTHCRRSVCDCWPQFRWSTADDSDGQQRPACVRKICEHSDHCRADDNPHLICADTVCECARGYSMNERHVCAKSAIGCNIVCQIFGGFFAIAFIASIVYWIVYCCYSLVKGCFKNSGNRSADSQPQTRSLLNANVSLARHADTDIGHRYGQSPAGELDNPPSYSQLMDEPPDYQSVIGDKNYV